MLKRSVTVIFLFLFSVTLLAQNKTILKPIGSTIIKGNHEVVNVGKKEMRNIQSLKTHAPGVINSVTGTLDTLDYAKLLGTTWSGAYFTMNSQDIMVTWYEAPTDLIIHSVGLGIYANDDNTQVSVKLVKFNRTAEQMHNAGTTYQGYYPSAGDGYDEIGAFPDEATGDWVSQHGDTTADPFDVNTYDLWSDAGFGWPITPTPNTDDGTVRNWVDMNNLGFEPTVSKGDIFGIVVSDLGTTLNAESVGFWYIQPATNYYSWKFYEDGRNVTGGLGTPGYDGGWWSREYIFDMVAAVEFTGDLPPTITDITSLNTTLSTDARTVEANITDTNPSGGASGVASATIKYSIDDGATWSDVAMSNTGGDTYSGDIPGQVPGTDVTYYVQATDVNGNVAQSAATFSYSIYKPTAGVNTLVVFNGFSSATGYPQSYYFGVGDFTNYSTLDFDHDVWNYGPLPAEAAAAYKNIIEISNSDGGPSDYNNDVISNWIAASPDNNYCVIGQEWLGAGNGYTDMDYAAGDFEYDILGLTHSYNDISYDGTQGQAEPSLVTPMQGSLLCDSLYILFNSMPTDSLVYIPYYELTATTGNWIDGFDVASGVDVDMTTESRGIEGAPDVQTLPCIAHHTLAAGNKVAFMSLDPLALDTRYWADDGYYWYGFTTAAPQVQVLRWFGADVVGVEKVNNNIPAKYELSQNYPNPFNPTTLINYDIPNAGNVTLTIYDVLGRKVTELVNTFQQAGSYKVSWDGTNQYGTKVTSGAYFYQLRTTNGFIETKKMVLLK